MCSENVCDEALYHGTLLVLISRFVDGDDPRLVVRHLTVVNDYSTLVMDFTVVLTMVKIRRRIC